MARSRSNPSDAPGTASSPSYRAAKVETSAGTFHALIVTVDGTSRVLAFGTLKNVIAWAILSSVKDDTPLSMDGWRDALQHPLTMAATPVVMCLPTNGRNKADATVAFRGRHENRRHNRLVTALMAHGHASRVADVLAGEAVFFSLYNDAAMLAEIFDPIAQDGFDPKGAIYPILLPPHRAPNGQILRRAVFSHDAPKMPYLDATRENDALVNLRVGSHNYVGEVGEILERLLRHDIPEADMRGPGSGRMLLVAAITELDRIAFSRLETPTSDNDFADTKKETLQ